MLVINPAAANVADPGREVGHAHQFLVQPGEIGDVAQVQHACLAFITWGGVLIFIHMNIIQGAASTA